ncbi:hypothetical protein Tco_0084524 [Tanacetum coccineum]
MGLTMMKSSALLQELKAIRLFLVLCSFKDFVVLSNGCKKSFSSMGKIEEEVLVCQPPGFEDLDFPNRVYKKFGFTEVKTASTPMENQKLLLKDENGKEVDVHIYRYQVNPKVSHLHAVKRIFRYLKGQLKLGLWYPKDSLFDLVAYNDSDYAKASLDRKSTTGEIDSNGQNHTDKNVADLLTKAFDATVKAKNVNGEVQLQALVDGKKIIITESTVRNDLQLEDAKGVDCLPNATIFEQLALMSAKTTAWNEFSSTMASVIIYLATNHKFNFSKYIFESMVKNLENVSGKFLMYPSGPIEHVVDEAAHKEMGDSLVRAATTASNLEAEQDSGGGPRRQETMGDTTAQTRFESVSKLSNDTLLARGNTLQSGEDSLKLNELMDLCTNLQTRVLFLENTKTTQASEIDSLKRMVKRLEKKKRDEQNLGEDASKQGRINAIDADEDITLVNDQDDTDMFDVNTLAGEEVFVAEQSGNVVEEVVDVIDAASTIPVSVAIITDVEVTLAQALAYYKLKKKKKKKNKKGFREKAHQTEEANIAWDDVQAKIEVDYQLAQRLQAQEQEELTDEEKARLFVQFLEQRRKHFAAKRAEEKRNRPPTRAQQRSIMCTYLKNMEGWKPKNLKNKSFANIQELFDKAMKRVNTFVDYRTELVEESSKKAEVEIA